MFNFGAGTLIAVQTIDATGATVANPTPVRLGTLQEVQGDLSFELKKLYGAKQYPVAVGRGKASLSFKAKTGEINANVLSSLLFGQTVGSGARGSVIDSALSVPGSSSYTITPTAPSSGTITADLGVTLAATGVQLTRVASAPATGQYSFSAGVYTFNSAQASAAVLISFEYTASTGSLLTINNQLMGASPFFTVMLQEQYQGSTFSLKLNSCTSSKLSLPFKNEDFTVSDFDFEAMSDNAGVIGYASLF